MPRTTGWTRARRAARASILLFSAAAGGAVHAAEPILSRSVLRPDRYRIVNASNAVAADTLRAAGSLALLRSLEGQPGWLEFDFRVERSGWHVVGVVGTGVGIDYRMDPKPDAVGDDGILFFGTAGKISPGRETVGNVWLSAGPHVLRLERFYWTGFPKIDRVEIRPAGETLAESIRIQPLRDGPYRVNECPSLQVVGGGRPAESEFEVRFAIDADGPGQPTSAAAPVRVVLPASAGPLTRAVALPCDRAGRYVATLGEAGPGRVAQPIAPVRYEVLDTRPPPAVSGVGDLSLRLVAEIDVANKAPDYFAGEEPRTVLRGGLAYRESGDRGWTRYQRAPALVREVLAAPSWFAYRLAGLEPQQAHLVEVEYPDDDDRSFVVALRESRPLAYPLSYGADTGPGFGLSGRTQSMRMLYWPRTADPRVVIMNAHDGRRAAASRIRVYRIDGAVMPMAPPGLGRDVPRREFVSWYEEGSNFLSVFGAPDDEAVGTQRAVERWADTVAHFGGTTLVPTISIYSFGLFRSRVDPVFAAAPDQDTVRRILLSAERRGLRVVPELHPRADFLSWPYMDTPEPQPQLLADKDGRTSFRAADGRTRNFPPHHNPLFPANRQAYLAMIDEVVKRYRDSPALAGISLRVMNWANPALNNFVSLDWGYDDLTVRRFVDERRIAMPTELLRPLSGADRGLARARYDWLIHNARESWIDWRCAKITELVASIRDRIRLLRPDLVLYIPVFAAGVQSSPALLREAGIDTSRLGAMSGVVLINALYTYGRRDPDDAVNRRADAWLADPSAVRQFVAPGGMGAFLTTAAYLEATETVVPPTAIGFGTDTRVGWTSAAAAPAGRNGLARFAIPLAETDASVLGDGGNMYTFGQAELRDFLREYRALPALPFARLSLAGQRADAAIVVRGREEGDGYRFYAVNRSNRAATVRLAFGGDGALQRVTTGQRVLLSDNVVTIALEAYALQVFHASGTLRPH